jgi:hypothetical protein
MYASAPIEPDVSAKLFFRRQRLVQRVLQAVFVDSVRCGKANQGWQKQLPDRPKTAIHFVFVFIEEI